MKNLLYLTQTDTTIGFVSQDATKIDRVKQRLPNKHYIRTVKSLEVLKEFTRVPTSHKNHVRRAKQSTFIMPNGRSFRVVKASEHNLLLDRVGWLHSSSANLSGEGYDQSYAQSKAEVIVHFPKEYGGEASNIYRLGRRERFIRMR